MKKRILYVGNDMQYFFMHRFPLAIAARDSEYEVHAALPMGKNSEGLSKSGIHWHSLPLKRGGIKPLYDAAALISLCRLYRSLNPDIIHHHTIKPVIFGGFCARITGMRGVVSGITGLGHAFVSKGLLANVRRSLIKSAYRAALAPSLSCVIFQNRDDMQVFLQAGVISPDKARLIRGSGVDLEKYHVKSEPQGHLTVALVSRMLWSKGIGEFVDAAKILKSESCDVQFLLVGDVDETNPDSIPEKQLRIWDYSGAVKWVGWVEDMQAIYESSSIVCLPSKYGEGVPRSLIEAAACGRPIVTTDSPGCREIVRHGDNGYLVPTNNFEALADSLKRLLQDSDLRRQMGMRGREIAEAEFSQEKVIKETLAVYKELIQ